MPDGTLLQRLLEAANGPRFWVLLGGGFNRGAGFATSFLVARFSGAHALGEYSALLNTAVAVVQPFVQVMNNNSTLLAVEANRESAVPVVRVAVANLLLGAVLSAVSFLVFLPLEHLALSGHRAGEYPLWLGLITASSVIVGQICGAVFLGTYYGMGRFIESARVSVAVSATVVVFAVPTIFLWGLTGAYVALMVASVATPMALAYSMYRDGQFAGLEVLGDKEAVRKAVVQFRKSLPSIATIAVGFAVSWLCTIYFVQRSFGLEGVGLVALAMQWLALMMLAEGSWGGVTLKTLAEAAGSGTPSDVRKATLGLLRNNVMVTLAVASIVVIGAGWIASFYGLGNRGLDLLIRLNAACAIIGTCNNIFQRVLLCLNQQNVWFMISVVRLAIQLSITVAFIETGLSAVMWGVLAGSLVQMLFCILRFDKMVADALAKPR